MNTVCRYKNANKHILYKYLSHQKPQLLPTFVLTLLPPCYSNAKAVKQTQQQIIQKLAAVTLTC